MIDKKLIRKLAKCCIEGAHASEKTNWELTVGEAYTGIQIAVRGKTGEVRPFSDAAFVTIPPIKRIHLDAMDFRAVADLVCRGYRLEAVTSAGSMMSASKGLGFYYLKAVAPHHDHNLTVGETVFCNGELIITGPCCP